jgi:hypothetical protein
MGRHIEMPEGHATNVRSAEGPLTDDTKLQPEDRAAVSNALLLHLVVFWRRNRRWNMDSRREGGSHGHVRHLDSKREVQLQTDVVVAF